MMRAAVFSLAILVAFAAPALADTPAPYQAADAASEQIVVPARTIARGEVITEADLGYMTVAARRVYPGIATAFDQLSGKQARRVLRPGEPVRTDDVRAPILVTKGQRVSVTFEAPGIALTAIGKALGEGGLGDSVTVLNPVSYRQITATVTGPGAVSVGGADSVVSQGTQAQLAAVRP